MAHPCCICDSECYCNGDIDDGIVSLTPKKCNGCDSCQDDASHDFYEDEEEEEYDEDEALNDISG